jgi:hypothetical protein
LLTYNIAWNKAIWKLMLLSFFIKVSVTPSPWRQMIKIYVNIIYIKNKSNCSSKCQLLFSLLEIGSRKTRSRFFLRLALLHFLLVPLISIFAIGQRRCTTFYSTRGSNFTSSGFESLEINFPSFEALKIMCSKIYGESLMSVLWTPPSSVEERGSIAYSS